MKKETLLLIVLLVAELLFAVACGTRLSNNEKADDQSVHEDEKGLPGCNAVMLGGCFEDVIKCLATCNDDGQAACEGCFNSPSSFKYCCCCLVDLGGHNITCPQNCTASQ